MKNIWKWILGIAVILVGLFVLPFLFGGIFRHGYGGMMGGYESWGHPMMYGYGSTFGWPLMGIGMLLVWGIPLGLVVLAIYGVVHLVSTPKNLTNAIRSCPNCGKQAQNDWITCPYCGTSL